MIDPGHGGDELGAVGPTGLQEKAVNLQVAYVLKGLFEGEGANVYLTRDGDFSVLLLDRVRAATEREADLFLSIHHNSNSERREDINRTEVYYPPVPFTSARDLAFYIAESIAREKGIGFTTPLPARYRVLRDNVPLSLIVEPSYISNPEEEIRLRDPEYLKREALAIFRAVRSYFEKGRPRVLNFCLKDWKIRARVVNTGRSGVDENSIEVLLNGKPLPFYFDEGELTAWLPERMPQGKHIVEIRALNLEGHRSDPFRYSFTVKRPAESISVSIEPSAGWPLLLVSIRFLDKYGSPLFKGEKVTVKPEDCRILEMTERTDSNGEISLVVKLEKDAGILNLSARDFSSSIFLKNMSRTKFICGRIIDQKTGRGISDAVVRLGDQATVSRFGGFFYFPVTDDSAEMMVFRNGYERYSGAFPEDTLEISLSPLFEGLLIDKVVAIEAEKGQGSGDFALKVGKVLAGNLRLGGARPEMSELPEGEGAERRLFRHMDLRPDYTLILRESRDFFIGYYELHEESRDFARRIQKLLGKLGFSAPEPVPLSEYLLIQYSGVRVLLGLDMETVRNRRARWNLAYSLFCALLQDAGFKGNEVRGRAIDANGVPLFEGFVRSFCGIGSFTDAEGCFTLCHLQRGVERIVLEKDGLYREYIIDVRKEREIELSLKEEGKDGNQGD